MFSVKGQKVYVAGFTARKQNRGYDVDAYIIREKTNFYKPFEETQNIIVIEYNLM